MQGTPGRKLFWLELGRSRWHSAAVSNSALVGTAAVPAPHTVGVGWGKGEQRGSKHVLVVFNSIPGSRLPLPAGAEGTEVAAGFAVRAWHSWHSWHSEGNSPAGQMLMQEGRRGAGLGSSCEDLSVTIRPFQRAPAHIPSPSSVLPALQALHVPIHRNEGCRCKISGTAAAAAVPRYNSTNTSIVTFNVIFHQRKERVTWMP